MNPYRALADAIILKAVDDYREYEELRGDIAVFFRSDWFKALTDIDGEYLLKRLKDELNQDKQEGQA